METVNPGSSPNGESPWKEKSLPMTEAEPPEGALPAPARTKAWHIWLALFAGVVIGVLFTLGITWQWQGVFQQGPQWPTVELKEPKPQDIGERIPEVPGLQNIDIQKETFATPKSSVSQAYHESFNALVKAADAIQTLNNEKLTPVLSQMNEKNTAGDYSGFFDLIVQAKELNQTQRGILNGFRSELDRLRIANQRTTDAAINTETARFIIAGTEFHEAFIRYATVIDTLLNGKPPDQKTLQELQASVDAINQASKTFGDALTGLFKAIQQRLQVDAAK